MLSETLKTELALSLKNVKITCLKVGIEGRFRIFSSRSFHSFMQKGKKRHGIVQFYKMVPQMEVLSSGLPYVPPPLSGEEEHLIDKQVQSH